MMKHISDEVANSFGGHELMMTKEAIGSIVGTLEHLHLCKKDVQDKQLLDILISQTGYLTQVYNLILHVCHSAQEPKAKLEAYMMHTNNNMTTFGLTEKDPSTPIMTLDQVDDQIVSTALLSHLKGIATILTTASIEATHPVLRRLLADSIHNIIEMAFEIYLYQNEKGYYEVPQYNSADMKQLIINFGLPIQTP